jgi:hypothetical protein
MQPKKKKSMSEKLICGSPRLTTYLFEQLNIDQLDIEMNAPAQILSFACFAIGATVVGLALPKAMSDDNLGGCGGALWCSSLFGGDSDLDVKWMPGPGWFMACVAALVAAVAAAAAVVMVKKEDDGGSNSMGRFQVI